MSKKLCPLIKMGISPSNTGLGGDSPDRRVIDACLKCKLEVCLYNNGRKPIALKSDKSIQKYYQCSSCFEKTTLYFEGDKLELVKEVVPREYRGSRKLEYRLVGAYTQRDGLIFHRHKNGKEFLCRAIG